MHSLITVSEGIRSKVKVTEDLRLCCIRIISASIESRRLSYFGQTAQIGSEQAEASERYCKIVRKKRHVVAVYLFILYF